MLEAAGVTRVKALGFVIPVIAFAGLGAQAPEDPVATLKIGTRVVSVAAVVLDGNGAPVRGLDKAEFVLKQDGREQAIRYFSEDMDLPLTLALMVDVSGSERPFLQDEIRASEVFFKSMLRRPSDRAALFQFDATVQQVVPMTSALGSLETTLNFLPLPRTRSLAAAGHGGTLLYDAIAAGAQVSLGSERGRRAMVLLTDGDDEGSTATLEQATAAAQKADVVVYSVLFSGAEGTQLPRMAPRAPTGRRPGSSVLKEISEATGGRMFAVSRALPLREIYEQIEEDMRLQYQIGYTPPEARPGSYHKIELKVLGEGPLAGHKLAVQARKGFYTPQS